MRDTAGEVTFFYWPLYMDVPVLADQQELTYNSSAQDTMQFGRPAGSDR